MVTLHSEAVYYSAPWSPASGVDVRNRKQRAKEIDDDAEAGSHHLLRGGGFDGGGIEDNTTSCRG